MNDLAVMYQAREKSVEVTLLTWKMEQIPPKLSKVKARAIFFSISKKESDMIFLSPVVTSRKQQDRVTFRLWNK